MAKGRIYYYVVEENGEKDGLAYIDCRHINLVGDFVQCEHEEGSEIYFPKWRVVEINIYEDDDDE